MKIISKIRRFFDLLLGFESKNDPEPPVDTLIDIIPPIEGIIVNEQSLDVPPPLEPKIISPEPTAPLVMDECDQVPYAVENRSASSEKESSPLAVATIHSEDNAQFEKLLENICLAMEDFEKKSENFAKQPGDKVYKFIRSKLIDRLMQSGASIIKDEDSFDLLRHNPVEISEHTVEGCKIAETIRPGIEYGGKVYIRAIVKFENV